MSRSATVTAWLSITETISFLVLLAMMATGNESGVSVVGMTHGLLFAAYALVVWMQRDALGWSTRFAVIAIVTGPVGAIIALERLRRDRRSAADRSPASSTPRR